MYLAVAAQTYDDPPAFSLSNSGITGVCHYARTLAGSAYFGGGAGAGHRTVVPGTFIRWAISWPYLCILILGSTVCFLIC